MSSNEVEYIDGAQLATLRRVFRNGGAVRVRCNAQISEAAFAPVPEVKSKKQRVASGEYVCQKKWNVIRRYDTGDNARLDAEERERVRPVSGGLRLDGEKREYDVA